jgi:hypothetical protein
MKCTMISLEKCRAAQKSISREEHSVICVILILQVQIESKNISD